jgi:arylsulfatase A-like enzyme
MRILYLDCDTLRADHLGCYGYCRDTSPNIDRIAGEGVRFDSCYASDAPCLPSRAALHTGRFGIQTGVVNHGGLCADLRPEGPSRSFRTNRKQWMDQMRAAGFRTVSVSPFAERHSAWWFYAGFNECHNTGKGGAERADEIYPVTAKWLDENAGNDNWFLHVNFWDPHTPYRTPNEYGNPFEGKDYDRFLSEEDISRHYRSYGPHGAQDTANLSPINTERHPRLPANISNLDDYRMWIDGYDVGIRYMDDYIGRILDIIEKKGVLEDTAVIVSSDHGEAQGELGVYGDHHFADHATSRIPLIVRWPGVKPRVSGGRIYQMDLAPTVCELVGGGGHSTWQSQSFADEFKAGRDRGRDELVLSMMAWSCNRSVRWDRWLMMRVYDPGLKPVPDCMLFDLDQDPHQLVNLAERRPEVLNEGLARLERWTARQLATSPETVDPLQTVLSEGGPFHTRNPREFEKYLRRLRETDRADCADELEARWGEPGRR